MNQQAYVTEADDMSIFRQSHFTSQEVVIFFVKIDNLEEYI